MIGSLLSKYGNEQVCKGDFTSLLRSISAALSKIDVKLTSSTEPKNGTVALSWTF